MVLWKAGYLDFRMVAMTVDEMVERLVANSADSKVASLAASLAAVMVEL